MKTKFAVVFKETFESREEAELFMEGLAISHMVESVELEDNESDDIVMYPFIMTEEEWKELMQHEYEVELNVPDYD